MPQQVRLKALKDNFRMELNAPHNVTGESDGLCLSKQFRETFMQPRTCIRFFCSGLWIIVHCAHLCALQKVPRQPGKVPGFRGSA